MTGSGKSPPYGIYYAGVFALIVLLIYLRLENVGLIKQLKVLLAGFLLVGAVVAISYVVWHVRNMPTTPTAVELSRRFEEVRFMSGAQFEVFVADLFRAMGHQATVLGGAGDQGVDIIVNPGASVSPYSARTIRDPRTTSLCRKSSPERGTTGAWRPGW